MMKIDRHQGRIFNKLISQKIESYIDKLRNYRQISIGTLSTKSLTINL